MRIAYITLTFCSLVSFNLLGQITVSGYVSGENQGMLIGANVSVDNMSLGAACDVEGYYKINIPVGAEGAITLTATYIGYNSQSILINLPSAGMVNQDFSLEIDAIGMESVVIVGYGTQKRGDLSTAITSV